MPINDLIRHLRVLDSQQSWRYSQLPQQITLEVLKQLDDSRLIEVRLRRWRDIGERVTNAPVPDWRGWFVVRDNWRIAFTLDELLKHPDNQGECEPEFQVSPTGKEWLLRAEQAAPGEKSETMDPATQAMAIILQEPDISPTELAKRVGVSRGTLYSRSAKWKAVRQTLRARDTGRIPKGTKGTDEALDAEAEYREFHATEDADG